MWRPRRLDQLLPMAITIVIDDEHLVRVWIIPCSDPLKRRARRVPVVSWWLRVPPDSDLCIARGELKTDRVGDTRLARKPGSRPGDATGT